MLMTISVYSHNLSSPITRLQQYYRNWSGWPFQSTGVALSVLPKQDPSSRDKIVHTPNWAVTWSNTPLTHLLQSAAQSWGLGPCEVIPE